MCLFLVHFAHVPSPLPLIQYKHHGLRKTSLAVFSEPGSVQTPVRVQRYLLREWTAFTRFFFFLSCFKKSILHMSQKFDDKISYFLFVEKKSWNFVLPFVIVPYHNSYMWVFSILTKNIFWFCSLCTCDPKNEFTTTFILLNNSQIILLVSIQLWSLICGGTLLKVL